MKKLAFLVLGLTLMGGATVGAAAIVTDTSMPGVIQKLRHICGVRFCGHHCHHHCHDWCDRRGRHWHCPGHD